MLEIARNKQSRENSNKKNSFDLFSAHLFPRFSCSLDRWCIEISRAWSVMRVNVCLYFFLNYFVVKFKATLLLARGTRIPIKWKLNEKLLKHMRAQWKLRRMQLCSLLADWAKFRQLPADESRIAEQTSRNSVCNRYFNRNCDGLF